jgi:hypothetical protein
MSRVRDEYHELISKIYVPIAWNYKGG